MGNVPKEIVEAFGFGETAIITPFGGGNINNSYKVTDGDSVYMLQTVNTHVFKNPHAIDKNLRLVKAHLAKHYPEYYFPAPLPSKEGTTMVFDNTGIPWRILPFVLNSECFDEAHDTERAFLAAQGFAQFTKNLSGIPLDSFEEVIPHFHDLTFREAQLNEALQNTSAERKEKAKEVIEGFQSFSYVGDRYRELIASGAFKKRIQHFDTKINNILFRAGTCDVLCVIDLDTIMPGYLFSDLGELIMFGTCAFEDETDLSKVFVDEKKYNAIVEGYLSVLGDELTEKERELIPFTGMIMSYMLGTRFLADYLNGEVYFKTKYEGQNLDKARNRLKLLSELAKRVT